MPRSAHRQNDKRYSSAAYSERMAFEIEIEYYNELRPQLLKEHGEGKFVVIKWRELLGVFETNDEAYSAGLNAYGVVSFLLRPIRKVGTDPRDAHGACGYIHPRQ